MGLSVLGYERNQERDMNREYLKNVLRGVIVATATPFDDDFEVDYGTMAELTEWWVTNGLVEGRAVIKCVSVMGEVPQLTDDEWPRLLKTVVESANGRAPVLGGIHAKDTKRSIADALKAQELGATGVQVSPPLFNDPTQDDMLRYFEALSDAIDIGIMVYGNPWLPHGEIIPETFRKMAEFEQVVALKWSMPSSYDYDEVGALTPFFNVFENNGINVAKCYRLGGNGFLDEQATAYPQHDLSLLDLLEAGKLDEAQALRDSVSLPLREFHAKIGARSGGQARVKKGVMAAMGMPIGSMRPPSLPLSEEEMDELRDLLRSFGWPVPEA